MRKLIPLLLVLTLCLAGCGGKAQPVSHTHEDLTISLPQGFLDLSGAEFAGELTFLYALEPITVSGLRDEKAAFAAYDLQLDLRQYGELTLLYNEVDSLLTQKDGIYTFSYGASGYTYVVTLWETQDAFWTVQAYCPTENYSDVKDQMWEILSSVTV